MWLTLLFIAIIIGAVLGFINSEDGDKGAGALGGALTGGMGCGYVLFQLFIAGLGILIVI